MAVLTQQAKQCGECNLCCKVVAVESIDKPAGVWCRHARPGKGCSIYDSRPNQCSGFQCLWLEDPELPQDWKPSKCKFVVRADNIEGALAIDVDPGNPNAWKKEPYYEQIKSWSRITLSGKGRVLVYVGDLAWAVFPMEDIYIGTFMPGEFVETGYRRGSGWIQPLARIHRGDKKEEMLGKRWPMPPS